MLKMKILNQLIKIFIISKIEQTNNELHPANDHDRQERVIESIREDKNIQEFYLYEYDLEEIWKR